MMKISLIQMNVVKNKLKNIENAKNLIINAVKNNNANFVVLPEMFNCPYNIKYFKEYSENENKVDSSITINFLKEISKSNKIYLVGGSIPEIDDQGLVYNTSYVFDPSGNLIGKHRKLHLFDINIPNKIVFEESKVLTKGDKPLVFDTIYGKIGVCICYDIRFQELIRCYRDKGASMVIIPAAFNMTTGPLHWEILARSRAIDNQLFIAMCSSAQSPNKEDYQSYGHTMLINSKGEVLDSLEFEENQIVKEINLKEIEEIRQNIPIINQVRNDLYELKSKF